MPNMSYCRFQNTLQDLIDCNNNLNEMGDLETAKEKLSPVEYRALLSIIELSEDFCNFKDDDDDDEPE